MAWFDNQLPGKLVPAQFDDVTPRQRRQPSWLSRGRRHSVPVMPVSLPGPPALPSDVAAEPTVHGGSPAAEMLKHYRPDEPRESLGVPSGEHRQPSMSPAELETLVAERALRQVVEHHAEVNRAAIAEGVQRIVDAYEHMAVDVASRAVELATLIARRVVARELHISKDIVVDLVREGLEVLNVRDRVRVHLGHEFAALQNALVAHYSALGTSMDVIIDPSLPAFGCVVETDVGSVDESIESRLAALLDTLSDTEER